MRSSLKERGEAKKRSDQIQFESYLIEEARRDALVKPSMTRLIGNRVKLALMQCIMECKDKAITSTGDMCDLFMTGAPVVNKRNASVLLRMVQRHRGASVFFCGWVARSLCFVETQTGLQEKQV